MTSRGTNQRVSSFSDIKGFFRKAVTASDRHVISQFLLDGEKDIKEYDAEMNRLRTAIHMLENKKKKLERTIEKCRSLLAPLHRLPVEVLTIVFSHACKPNALLPDNIAQVVQLSWVCGRWREIVLGTPSLWARLELSFARWDEKFTELERVLPVFLERSKAHPLDLELDFKESGGYTQEVATTFSTLFDHRTRWRRVALVDIPPEFSPPDADREIHFLSLESLKLVSVEDVPKLRGLFKNSPSLLALNIICPDYDLVLSPEFVFPWHQIRCLKITHSFASDGLRFLSLFPHLRTLELNCFGGGILDYHDHLLLTTIKSLALGWESQEDPDTTLPFLTLPELTSLRISSYHSKWELDETSLTNFLTRSACSITTFVLDLDFLFFKDHHQIIVLLELMPTLTTLELIEDFSVRHIRSGLLQHFVVDNESWRSGPPFLPLLTHLHLAMSRKNLVEQDLFDIVVSRWVPDPTMANEMGVVCLRSLAFAVRRAADADLKLPSLQCFRDAGLRFSASRQRQRQA